MASMRCSWCGPPRRPLLTVPHGFSRKGADQTQQPPNLFSSRVALLLCQDNAAVVAAARCPCGVDLVEVSDIERVERLALSRSQTEVVFILPADHARVGGSDYVNSTRPKTPNDVAVHRILVYVQAKAAHCKLCPGRENFCYGGVLGSNVTVNLIEVGVVVGQGGVNLSQREVLHLGGDFFGSQAHIVPPGNPPDRNTGTGNAGPAFADFRRPLDQAPNIHGGSHIHPKYRSLGLGLAAHSESRGRLAVTSPSREAE
jgi:hypothetical protein